MANKSLADDASRSMASLYVFDAVIGALDNGTIRGDTASKAATKIISIAKKAQADLLDEYDLTIEKITD